MADETTPASTTEPAGAASGVAITPGSATPDASAAAPGVSAAADAPTPAESILGAKVEAKPEDGKPAEEKKPEEAKAPEPIDPKSYKVEFPEGVKADDAVSAKFLDAAAKAGLSNDAVQALAKEIGPEFAALSKTAGEFAEAAKKFQDMNTSWQSECKADPEFGGAKLPDTLATVRKAFDAFLQPPEVKALDEALNLTGAGNHPAVLRAFHRLASRLSEGTPVQGRPAGAQKTAAEIMYPNQARAS